MKFELIAGIVITGGGAQIKDLKECATDVFGLHVRIGNPLNITGVTHLVEKNRNILQYLAYYSMNIVAMMKAQLMMLIVMKVVFLVPFGLE